MSRHTEETRAIDKSLGKTIKELRLTMGLSRKQLADQINVTHQQQQKYEFGKNRITVSRLVLIARALKKPVSYFIADNDEPEITEHQRLCIETSRNFLRIKDPKLRVVVANLTKVLSE